MIGASQISPDLHALQYASDLGTHDHGDVLAGHYPLNRVKGILLRRSHGVVGDWWTG